MSYLKLSLPVLPLLLAALATTAHAQQAYPGGNNMPQPTAATRASSNVVAVPAYQPAPIVNAYGYAPPSGYYATNPYGSYLSGKADVINARANAGYTVQQSRLVQEEVSRSQLQTRRAILDEARFERETTMNSEQVRMQQLNDSLRRARNEPPQSEIWSGQALNALFSDIQRAHTYGVRGPAVPLDADLLKQVNLTTGVSGSASIGMFKDGPKLKWPVVLLDQRFEAERMSLQDATAKALEAAQRGPVEVTLLAAMQDTIERMQVILKQLVQEVESGPYMDGKRYLRELASSTTALRDPNVANYFNSKWSAQGATVDDLVANMTSKGLKFAPAVSGGQPSYSVLYQAMLTYDVQMTQAVSR